MAAQLDLPHFAIIGAMKCATSTLHDQLARQPSVLMSDPKEPNFFSDQQNWDRGLGWYRSLFEAAGPGSVCGESSTHYTKLPTYPKTVERFQRSLPHAKLIYVMRNPIDRIVSQYIHQWSERTIDEPIEVAVQNRAELVAYSRYAMQLEPWLEAFGSDRILPVFFERLTRSPQTEFARIGQFIGLPEPAIWLSDEGPKNVSATRLRYGMQMERVLDWGPARFTRRLLLTEKMRERIKSRWRMETRPELSASSRAWCVAQLDPDMARLGQLLGLPLNCETFSTAVLDSERAPEWKVAIE